MRKGDEADRKAQTQKSRATLMSKEQRAANPTKADTRKPRRPSPSVSKRSKSEGARSQQEVGVGQLRTERGGREKLAGEKYQAEEEAAPAPPTRRCEKAKEPVAETPSDL